MQSRRFSFLRTFSVLFAVLGLSAALPVAAHSAPQPAAVKIAVVDLQRVMNEAKVTSNIQSQVDKQRTSYQQEIAKLESELKAAEQQISKLQGDTGDVIQQKADFEKKVIESKQLVQKRRSVLEKGATDAMDEVRKETLKIISEIADKKKYDAVLTRQAVIVADKSLDITDDVLKDLNSRLSKVTVKFDSN